MARQRNRRLQRIGALVIVLLALASGTAYATAPTWTESRQHLPVDRKDLDSYNARSFDVDCVSASYCVVVGDYDTNDPSLPHRSFLDIERGAHSASIAAPLPAGAQGGQLAQVSCGARGQCVAIGFYISASDSYTPLVEAQVDGRWVPRKLGSYLLDHVDCARTVCAVSGGDNGDYTFALRDAAGTWRFPELIPPDGMTFGAIDGVSCAGSTCYAFGRVAPVGGGQVRPVLLLPDGDNYRAVYAETPASDPGYLRLTGMSCPNESTCYAIGSTGSTSTPGHLVIDTLTGGVVQAEEPTLPTDVASQQVVPNGISCDAGGHCAVKADYGIETVEGFQALGWVLLTNNAHVWHAVTAPVPARWSTDDVELFDVSCAAGTTCVAVGVVGEHARRHGFVESYQNGTWRAKVLPVPSFASQRGTATSLGRISCVRTGCLALGEFYYYGPYTYVIAAGPFLARAAITP
jgi:hypothetical protein